MAEGFGNFEKLSGKRSRVRTEEGKKLGEGSMADVHEVEAHVQSGGKERQIDTLVTKQYKDVLDLGGEAAELALRNYGLLKSIGFPVPPTYRLDRESHTILMTNIKALYPGSVSITNSQSEEVRDFLIERMSNFEEIARKMLQYAEAAAAHGIDLGFDAYNLAMPRSGTGEGRLYFTDLEMIDVVENNSADEKKRVLSENIDCAQEFLTENVVRDHVRESDRAPYLAEIDRIFSERKRQLGLPVSNSQE